VTPAQSYRRRLPPDRRGLAFTRARARRWRVEVEVLKAVRRAERQTDIKREEALT
jgi:hypothetical protein